MSDYVESYGDFSKGRKYLSFVREFYPKPWFDITCGLDRQQIRVLNRLRSGHSCVRAHLFSKNFRVEENCKCGEDILSVNHLLWYCPRLTSQRIAFFNICQKKILLFIVT